jgi:hypothetical protein
MARYDQDPIPHLKLMWILTLVFAIFSELKTAISRKIPVTN